MRVFVNAIAFCGAISVTAVAQQSTVPEPVTAGGYQISQSVEVGGRYSAVDGNPFVYATFVDLQTGPRLLEQSLSIHSVNHRGLLFDSLSMSSYGYGGDPSSGTRLRMYKNHWYNFNANFRRYENSWEYNLLANPLNPPTSNPAVPVGFSPHHFATVHRLGDYNLLIAPQSRVRLRLAYTNSTQEGPSLSSVNTGGFQGAQTALFQQWRESQSQYQVGVDFKLLPRTNFSFDEFLQYRKADTSVQDQSFIFQLANGVPADLGTVFNTPFVPCANPVISGGPAPPTANPVCNGFLGFSRSSPGRSSMPVEQVTFQSQYFNNLELSALFSYADASSDVDDLTELFRGLIVPLNLSQAAVSGRAKARNITVNGEFGATWKLGHGASIVEEFRQHDFRVPGNAATLQQALFAASLADSPNPFNPVTCPPPYLASTCPAHSFGSIADTINSMAAEFLGQSESSNLISVEYESSRLWGSRIGYGYVHRAITENGAESNVELFLPPLPNRDACLGQPILPNGTCSVVVTNSLVQDTPIDEQSLVAGFWFRPFRQDALRINFDTELRWADNTFTRIDLRQQQRYHLSAHFQPVHWASLSASMHLSEGRNGESTVQLGQHERNVNAGAILLPSNSFNLDLNYNFNDVFYRNLICYINESPIAGSTICPTDAGLFQTQSFYRSTTHFGSIALHWVPQRRVTASLGYSLTSANGDTLLLNPLAPIGPLRFNYHRPGAGVTVVLGRGVSWKANWGYYDYNEKSEAGPTLPRDFHANLGTVALKYSF